MKTLKDRRLYAAKCSAGISSSEIKSLIVRIIRSKNIGGKVLDFGAGTGELLEVLSREGLFQSLGGADILERPPHLDDSITWYRQDLNDPLDLGGELVDLVICSEVIEHLENPRATFRHMHQMLVPNGYLLLTTPNQESIRSFAALCLGGHFTHFLGNSYPAHITALLRLDLQRISEETGFGTPCFYYTNVGGIPKLPLVKWQQISFGVLRGRLFSDNVAMLAPKKS